MTSFVKRFVAFTLVLYALCGMVLAQPQSEKPKAAVYIKGNPQGREVLMMAVNTFLIKTGKYQMIAVDAIDVLAQEHIRQQSGSVSDNEIARLGRDAGAQYVCVVERTEIGGVSYVTTSMVSVQSKIAEFSDIKELPRGVRVINVIERQINAMLGIDSGEEHGGYESVSEPVEQQSSSVTNVYQSSSKVSPSTYPSSRSPSNSPEPKLKPRSKTASEPFDPSAVYLSANVSTVDSRDYGNKENHRSSLFVMVGADASGRMETRNAICGGLFLGGGGLGDGYWGLIVGIEMKKFFWLTKRHFAIPISLGIDVRHVANDNGIDAQVAAKFIDKMSATDKNSDSKMFTTMTWYDITPGIGLQIFINPAVSVYAGYAYYASIFTIWKAYYKIPGKFYKDSDKHGDAFEIPEEYIPIQNTKERFLSVPGTLRLDLKFHIGNFKS
jgi:hypothetical protein